MIDTTIAEQLVQHAQFEWQGLMCSLPAYSHGGVVTHRMMDDGCWLRLDASAIEDSYDACPIDPVPDLTDDATAGVLLGMLPTGWCTSEDLDGECFTVAPNVLAILNGEGFRGDTLGEAAARALLAVWEDEEE